MDRQEWLEWRKGGVGASDAPVFMGCHIGGKSLQQLKEEKLNGKDSTVMNFAMQRGNELEEEALKCFEFITGYKMKSQQRFEHPEFPWMRCTVDGINEEEGVLLEIKVPLKELHQTIPTCYYPQCQHTMEVVRSFYKNDKRYKKMFFMSYSPKEQKILECEFDEDYLKVLFNKEKEFWDEISSGYRDMKNVKEWKRIEKDLFIVHEGMKAAESLHKEQMKIFKETEFQLINEALLWTEGNPAKGELMQLDYVPRQGSVDSRRVKEETGIDINLYRKPPTYSWKAKMMQ